jgi:hypothetical protein
MDLPDFDSISEDQNIKSSVNAGIAKYLSYPDLKDIPASTRPASKTSSCCPKSTEPLPMLLSNTPVKCNNSASPILYWAMTCSVFRCLTVSRKTLSLSVLWSCVIPGSWRIRFQRSSKD